MSTRQKKNSHAPRLVFPLICILISAYFFHHTVNGRYGLTSREQAEATTLRLEFRLAELTGERKVLAHRVSLLKNGSIEKDMLDEQARYHLNLLREDEIVIMRN